jgi:hypothetical protein
MKKFFFYSITGNQKIIFVLMFFLAITACIQNNEKKSADKSAISSDTKFMSAFEIHLPDAPGADAFRANCITCHSARYIQTQPKFPAATWEKIVNKMVKNYGAPVSDSVAKNIVDYLANIKGEK